MRTLTMMVVLSVALAITGVAGSMGSLAFAQKPGGTLTIARPTDAVSLDPQQETTAPGTWVYQLILEPLLVLDTHMKVQPKLATSWKVLSPTRTRFFLRKGVRFHDGTPVNAEAVKFTYDRAFNPTSPGRWASLAGPIARVDVVDDSTVDIVTSKSYGPILNSVAMPYAGIVSPTAVQKMGTQFSRAPVGTGPFKFEEWRSNDRISIVRDPQYWGQKPYLDKIVFRVIPEESARTIALQTGEVDFVLQPAPTALPTFARDKRFKVDSVPGLRIVSIGMNLSLPPMNDVRVRRAIIHAVNRHSIFQSLLGDTVIDARGVLAPDIFGFADMQLDKLYPYDKGKAKDLLREAGYTPGPDGIMQRGGQLLTLKHISGRGRVPKDAEIGEAVQAQLREVGIDVKYEVQEWGRVFSLLKAATLGYHLFTTHWGVPTGDSDFGLFPVFDSKQLPPPGWNTARYSNPRVDKALEEAQASIDPAKRKELYAEAQRLIAQDLPEIPIYNTRENFVYAGYVKGFVPHPSEYTLLVHLVWLQK